MFMNYVRVKSERKVYQNYHYMPKYHIYIVHIGVINIFCCYISRSDHCEVLQELLILKIWQKDKSSIFRNVTGSNIFSWFLRVNGQSFKTSFADIFRNMYFLQCDLIYNLQETASGSAHELLAKSLETVFDEAHFIVNLHNFLQPLALPRNNFLPSETFVPHHPRQNNFQNSSPLDTSETSFPQFQ